MKHAAKLIDIACVKPSLVIICSEANGKLIDTKCVKPYLASDASVLHCSDALDDTYS